MYQCMTYDFDDFEKYNERRLKPKVERVGLTCFVEGVTNSIPTEMLRFCLRIRNIDRSVLEKLVPVNAGAILVDALEYQYVYFQDEESLKKTVSCWSKLKLSQ